MKRLAAAGIVLFLSLSATAHAAKFRGSAASDGSKVSGTPMRKVQFHDGVAEKEKKNDGNAKVTMPVALGKECTQPRPKALFCYSLVRTPLEPTAALLAKQLSVACDGWALFGETADPANNVTKAFSVKDREKGWAHQLREMVTTGVWKHLIETGALDEYEYFLRVDTDSFIRPSTLRKTFKALSTDCRRSHKLISIWNDDVDGYFGAVHADTALRMNSLGWPRECDVVLSGSDNDGSRGSAKTTLDEEAIQQCLHEIDGHLETLEDPLGRHLVASDSDTDDEGCGTGKVGGLLLGLAVGQGRVREPLCRCKQPRASQQSCVSEDFVTVHHVKDPGTYAELVKAFP